MELALYKFIIIIIIISYMEKCIKLSLKKD